jgi:hypothetical protein
MNRSFANVLFGALDRRRPGRAALPAEHDGAPPSPRRTRRSTRVREQRPWSSRATAWRSRRQQASGARARGVIEKRAEKFATRFTVAGRCPAHERAARRSEQSRMTSSTTWTRSTATFGGGRRVGHRRERRGEPRGANGPDARSTGCRFSTSMKRRA